MVSVWVTGLQGKYWSIWCRIKLDDSLHGKRTIDEIGRFVVDVLDVDDDALIVGICNKQYK